MTVSCIVRVPPFLQDPSATPLPPSHQAKGAHLRALISGGGFDAPRNLLSRR